MSDTISAKGVNSQYDTPDFEQQDDTSGHLN